MKPEIESKELITEYRQFEEFKHLADEQILEIDKFFEAYSESAYQSFVHLNKIPNGKLIQMNMVTNKKAA
jgi:hypothetical protein